MLALFKVRREKRNVLGFSLRQWRRLRRYDSDVEGNLSLALLSTTHERNPTFPCGSFPMNKTCNPGLIAASRSALKNFLSVSFAQENELQDFLQENKHLSLQLYNSGHKATKYEQVNKNGVALMCC